VKKHRGSTVPSRRRRSLDEGRLPFSLTKLLTRACPSDSVCPLKFAHCQAPAQWQGNAACFQTLHAMHTQHEYKKHDFPSKCHVSRGSPCMCGLHIRPELDGTRIHGSLHRPRITESSRWICKDICLHQIARTSMFCMIVHSFASCSTTKASQPKSGLRKVIAWLEVRPFC
jgi:hypothetical protein